MPFTLNDNITMSNLTNTQKLINVIRTKADASSISAVWLSNQYEDLDWKPIIPVVNSNKVIFQKNWNQYKEITDNSNVDQTVNIELSKVDVWLWNVDNTSDMQKPVSNAVQTELNKKANSNDVYTKAEVDSVVSSAIWSTYKYKWSVANYSDLPMFDNSIWDVWNVDADWQNYAWTWTWWDALWSTIDMSLYLTKNEASQLYTTKTEFNNSINGINNNLLNNYYTSSYIDSNYYNKSYVDWTFYTKTEIDTQISNIDNSITNIQTSISNIWVDKQDTLVSWVNIKTINNQSILWQWNIDTNQVLDDAYSAQWSTDATHAPSRKAVYAVLWDINTLLSNI